MFQGSECWVWTSGSHVAPPAPRLSWVDLGQESGSAVKGGGGGGEEGGCGGEASPCLTVHTFLRTCQVAPV